MSSLAADQRRQTIRPRRVMSERGELRALAARPAHATPAFGPLEGTLIVLPDEQLDALGAIFCQSPLRRAMTLEGYLAVKGYARERNG